MRYVFVVIFVVIGVDIVLASVQPFGEPYAAPAASEESEMVSACGTLTYERNNMGQEVPYLVFRLADGSLDVKSLTFVPASACTAASGQYPCTLIAGAIRPYFNGGPVSVVGTTDAEHITVSRMRLASAGQCAL